MNLTQLKKYSYYILGREIMITVAYIDYLYHIYIEFKNSKQCSNYRRLISLYGA